MVTTTTRPRFLRGYSCVYSDEIGVAEQLSTAIRVTVGTAHAREIAHRDPVKLFRPLRYGRTLHQFRGDKAAGIHVDFPGVADNRAAHRHILTPGRDEWREYVDRIVRLQRRRDYILDADGNPIGLYAAARALDDMGFALAESLAIGMLFNGANDDEVAFRVALVWRDGREHHDFQNAPAY